MINKHKSNKLKENFNTVRHLNNGTDHRHSKSCCDQSSPARRTITRKRFPQYWPFVGGIHRWQLDSSNKGPIMRGLIFFYTGLNKQLNKQSGCRWFDTPWSLCSVTVINGRTVAPHNFDDVTWALKRLKSQSTWLFVKKLVQTNTI